MDRDSEILIEYLRSRPAGAVVRWASDFLTPRCPRTTGWVDVRITDAAAPSWNWAWTIVGPDDPDASDSEQLWSFVWPHDLEVHGVWDPASGRYVNEWPAHRGEPPPRCIAAAYRTLPERIGGRYDVRDAWSADAVGEALSDWTATHAARPDLILEWDPESEPTPDMTRAAERAREIQEGGRVWDLGDRLEIADGLMDELLQLDPDEAAVVVARLREVRRRIERG